ncbi:MAG: hypothetical protein H0V00_20450 [Chloroflexia bacterium]|nr:hypothetical protein [Chloroflexia bacterium]
MKHRRATGLCGGVRKQLGRRVRTTLAVAVPAIALVAALVGVAPAQQAFAQQNSGGTIDIGGSIADTVASAVSSIATGSGGGSAFGGASVESNEASFGEDEGVSVSDASGGNSNVSANQGNHK